MNYKSMPLYQKINSINEGVKNSLKSVADFRKENLHQFKKVLVGRGNTFNKEPMGVEFDFVATKKSNFSWYEQTSKDDIALAAKVIYKSSIDSLKVDIEAELFKFHSIQALRKLLIIVNTVDQNTNESIVPYLVKNYDVFLNFPPSLEEHIHVEKCPMCGTSPSRIEAWFYNEDTQELLPVSDYIEDSTYFKA
ncbi:MAG: hypothetical protein H7263_00520 [Candidatus Sericytochromatia bacterium]|nr:hypothetical protein [Candidatus Sericytochromatia bacterium]